MAMRWWPSQNWEDSLKKILREYAETFLLAIVFAILLRVLIIGTYYTNTEAMAPTLVSGDFLFGYKLPFGVHLPLTKIHWGGRSPLHGELIVFHCPQRLEENCLKRAVALPGDVIEIKDQKLIINGTSCSYEHLGASVSEGGAWTELVEVCGAERRNIRLTDGAVMTDLAPQVVLPGQVFVLNDNRSINQDSREWGGVDIEHVIAKPIGIWLSLQWDYAEEVALPTLRWTRVFKHLY